MAEAAALIGLVAAITQLTEYGVRLIQRLEDLSSSVNDKAGAFTAIKVRLPVVLEIIKRIQKHVELHLLSSLDAKSLLPLIENTNGHVKSLLVIIERSMPSKGAPTIARYIKAMKSLSRDKEVERIRSQLQENLQVLSLVQTTSLVESSYDETRFPPTQTKAAIPCDKAVAARGRQHHAVEKEPSAGETVFGVPDGSSKTISETDTIDIQVSVSQWTARSEVDQSRFQALSDSTNHIKSLQPSLLMNMVGHLSVNCSGRAFVSISCNERRCRRREGFTAHMTYRFPTWVLNRALSIALSSTALNTKINLNTLRVLPDSADVFAVISRGDLVKLRDMFKAGQTSVYDVSRLNWTLIHTAFTLGRHEICQFLISEGADLSIDATNGSNVIERAWFLAQKTTKSPGDYVMCDNEVLREIDLDDFVSSQQYNLIHKIVLGITKLDLGQILETSTADIDGTDIRGATALSWAAAQGNISAVRMLLENGANPEIGAAMNQRPLHLSRNAGVAARRSTASATDKSGRLHPSFAKSSMQAPLSTQSRMEDRPHSTTPVMFGNTQLISPLLEAGANINALKDEELTPLMAGIRYDQAEAVEYLLEHGADWTIQNRHNQNILHMSALHAGPECMEVLVSAKIGPLNIHAQDSKGYTSVEYFETRRLRSQELDQAFQTLLRATTHAETDTEIDGDGERGMSHLVDSGLLAMPGSFSQA